LESIGCTQIRISGNTIKACNPDGDNRNAVCVYIDDYWNTEDFTRPLFQSREYRDIISFVEFIKDISFSKAIKYICQICNFDYYIDIQEEQQPAFLEWLNYVETGQKVETEDKLQPIPESVLNQFIQLPVKKWLDEQIDIRTQKEFGICVDPYSERLVIPIYDETSTLVGIKGRILDDNKIKDDKYIYLYPCPKNQILYGLHLTEPYIKNENGVFIFESEKSVMKMYSHGRKNCVALGGKIISERQTEIIQRLNVPITICMDADVSSEEINCVIEKLKYPVQTQPIYVLKDPLGLLGEKDSPCDDYETFEVLLSNYKEAV
jgi:DNA primase